MKTNPIDLIRDKATDWVWSNTPCCREMVRLLSRECETPLPLGLRIRMRLHLLCCRWCTRYRHQLQLINRLLATLSHRDCEHGEDHLSEDAKERIRQALKNL
jgi:predicted small metal-binding protein